MDDTRDPERTRAALLDAALLEFSGEAGPARARATIAARAGVNKQLISHHFGGKDGLYRALIERWLAERGVLRRPRRPARRSRRRATSRTACSHRDLHRLLLRASLEDEEDGGGVAPPTWPTCTAARRPARSPTSSTPPSSCSRSRRSPRPASSSPATCAGSRARTRRPRTSPPGTRTNSARWSGS